MSNSSPDSRRQLFCPILGMHRSGTSCLMRILHSAGVETGDNLAVDAEFDNLTGHWEPLEMIRINDRILASSGGYWNRVPQKLVVEDDLKLAIQAFLRQFANSAVVGWKDPRLTITFPAWRPYLPNYLVVACVRHPHAVAHSLMERGDMDFEDGVRLWTDYNERLLEYVAEAPRVFWFHYDGAAEAYASSLKSFCEHARLKFSVELLKLYNPGLTHHFDTADVTDTRAQTVYRRLIDLSQGQLQNNSLPTATNRASDDRATWRLSSSLAAEVPHAAVSDFGADNEPRVQIAQVIEILRAINLQQQRDRKAFRAVCDRLQSLEQRMLSHAAMDEKISKMTGWIEALDRTPACRIYRAVRGFLREQFSTRPKREIVAEHST